MTELTFELAAELLRYEPETGKLYWRKRDQSLFKSLRCCNAWNSRYAGEEAFCTEDGRGYLMGSVFGQKYKAHRIIWLLHTGSWPCDVIDHVNGDPSDNRLANLRSVSNQDNLRNQRRRATNNSGCTGVSWHKRDRRWTAQIWGDGRKLHLGLFESRDAAIAARKRAEQRLGYHQNHDRA